MVQIILVLHAYQPPYPVQETWIVDKVVGNCYRPVITKLLESNAKLVANFNASLLENLATQAPDLVSSINRAVTDGKLELLGSGAYHPIFPLIDDHWGQRQIELNYEINSNIFSEYNPVGFWPPELAVNKETLSLIKRTGHIYSIVPQTSVNSICKIGLPEGELVLVPRDKDLSNVISFKGVKTVEELLSKVEKKYGENPCVLAMDMETFGEHNAHYEEFLFDFLNDPRVHTLTFSDIDFSDLQPTPEFIDSSWSTDLYHLREGVPYPLWNHPANALHALILDHMDIVEKYVESVVQDLDDQDFKVLEIVFLKSQHSCQLWWADGEQGRWSPSMVRKGLDLQRRVLANASNILKEISGKIIARVNRVIEFRSSD